MSMSFSIEVAIDHIEKLHGGKVIEAIHMAWYDGTKTSEVYSLVLYDRGEAYKGTCQYVTWRLSCGGKPYIYSGNYFDSLDKAREDLKERARELSSLGLQG